MRPGASAAAENSPLSSVTSRDRYCARAGEADVAWHWEPIANPDRALTMASSLGPYR